MSVQHMNLFMHLFRKLGKRMTKVVAASAPDEQPATLTVSVRQGKGDVEELRTYAIAEGKVEEVVHG